MERSRADICRLFVARIARLFAFGCVSVVLALYLSEIGLNERAIGLLLTAALVGDAGITLWITTSADRVGRRRMLVLGAVLMILAGVTFAVTRNPLLLAAAAIVGVISPGGNEIGPFLSIEQAALSQLVTAERRTRVFASYSLVGSLATALGALAVGQFAHAVRLAGFTELAAYRAVFIGYALGGGLLMLVFWSLSAGVEIDRSPTAAADDVQRAAPAPAHTFGLHRSRGVVLRLSALFALDAFAGGFIVQSLMAYWFHLRFGVDVNGLGQIFFGGNLLAGVSALLAARLADRFGLINTMVFTHLPSNALLCLVPLMPTLPLAVTVLLLRFSISQMDVPTRQSYTMAVVAPDERSAASGVTAIARSFGAAVSPALSGALMARLMSGPFFVAGGLKIVYDLLLYRGFRSHVTEAPPGGAPSRRDARDAGGDERSVDR